MLYKNLIIDNRYQVLSELGQGGMGVVFLAYHLRLEKYVVLKKLKENIGDVSLLRNEVDILKGLHHPYLPQVYDFIKYDGDLYTVIDYVKGYDLGQYIKSGTGFSEKQLIKWLTQMCDVLGYLHSNDRKILHTDIKPSNIMITEKGDICLIDFGVSLIQGSSVKGYSTNYSSPEQYTNAQYMMRGQKEYYTLDERTDIYSLGATFYSLMTGKKPSVFKGETQSLTSLNTGYSEPFSLIIDKAMSYDREKRFKTADEMKKAINRMYRFDQSYRMYVLLQIAFSVFGAVLIIFGSIMLLSGYKNSVSGSFKNDYSEFVEYYENGDLNSAEKSGNDILVNSSYSKYLDSSKRAEICHAIGDSYYQNEDYSNASYYFDLAIEQNGSDDDKNVIYYRDYVFSLINEGKTAKAQDVRNIMSEKYPGRVESMLINAQMQYVSGDYEEAAQSIQGLLPSLTDSDNKYAAYIIQGDSNYKAKKYMGAVSSYERAYSFKSNITLLRKIGSSYLNYANLQNSVPMYKKAEEYYKTIIDDYAYSNDDIINYAQSCYLSNDRASYSECISCLENYLNIDSNDSRIYMCLAMLCSLNGSNQAGEYLERAHSLYNSMNREQIDSIDPAFMYQIKTLYNRYFNSSW